MTDQYLFIIEKYIHLDVFVLVRCNGSAAVAPNEQKKLAESEQTVCGKQIKSKKYAFVEKAIRNKSQVQGWWQQMYMV